VSRLVSVAVFTLAIVVLYIVLYMGTTFLPESATTRVWLVSVMPGILAMTAVAKVVPTSVLDLSYKHGDVLFVTLSFVTAPLIWGAVLGALWYRLTRQQRSPSR
jgi:hypothetical protein